MKMRSLQKSIIDPKNAAGLLYCTANLCNQSVTEGQQIDAILANFLLLQLLFTILADLWLQIKSASFKCKNYTYYLLHLKAALLKEN